MYDTFLYLSDTIRKAESLSKVEKTNYVGRKGRKTETLKHTVDPSES